MLVVTPDNVLDYLRSRGCLASTEPAHAEALGGGVSNMVVRVDAASGSLVLKQSREQLRTPDPWFSRLDRTLREADVMRALAELLPPPAVPCVIFEDRPNFLFAMTAVPREHEVWKTRLLQGLRADDRAIARCCGQLLGAIHASAQVRADFAQRFADRDVFHQLRVDPFYLRLAREHPDVAPALATLVAEMSETLVTLVHADFSPKNILVHGQGVTLVDYETAHWGDPAFDLGFFLSHLVLKAFKHAPANGGFFDLTTAFWESYLERLALAGESPSTAPSPPAAMAPTALVPRAIRHFAACAWARLDATSRIDYLPDPARRDAVRRLCRRLLLNPVERWADVLALAQAN